MTKIILAISLCTAFSLPAIAICKTTETVTRTTNVQDPACVPSTSVSGDTVYYTPTTNAQAAPMHTHRHAVTAQERRHEWLKTHTPSGMILGNMSGAAGTSALAYMHGTDNPQSHIFLDTDEGPSSKGSRMDRATATDSGDDEF